MYTLTPAIYSIRLKAINDDDDDDVDDDEDDDDGMTDYDG